MNVIAGLDIPEWGSQSVDVLLNPRLPPAQKEHLLDAFSAMPALPGHVWLTTSGSSGMKWVALSKQALLDSADAVNRHLESSATDTWVLALPTFHVGGLGVVARGFLSGARVERYADRGGEAHWSARGFQAFLEQTGATLTTLVPTQLHDLVRASHVSPPGLRAVVIGGGALSGELYREARLLGWPVLPSYGLSECCSQAATAALSSLEVIGEGAPPLELLSHIEARIGDQGRIALRSASLLTGYGFIGEGKAKARFIDPKVDGWLLTEDRGMLDGSNLTVLGRLGDFVKIGGESVDTGHLAKVWMGFYPSDTLPEAVLLAVPDERLGAAIYLVAAGEPAQAGALAHAIEMYNGSVLPFERIQGVEWVSALPRSPLGKLLRGPLLDEIVRRSASTAL